MTITQQLHAECRGYKAFDVIISQSGTDAPVVAKELEDTVGDVLMSYAMSAGTYNISGTFPAGRTVVMPIGNGNLDNDTARYFKAWQAGANAVTLWAATDADFNSFSNDFSELHLEIRVYNN